MSSQTGSFQPRQVQNWTEDQTKVKGNPPTPGPVSKWPVMEPIQALRSAHTNTLAQLIHQVTEFNSQMLDHKCTKQQQE